MSSIYCKYLSILLLFAISQQSVGMKYDITISNESRQLVEFMRFGFQSGFFHLSVNNLRVDKRDWAPSIEDLYKLGFILHYSKFDADVLPLEGSICTSSRTLQRFLLPLRNGTTTAEAKINDGYYTLYFLNCVGRPVSLKLHLEEYNMDSSLDICYLTSGLCSLNILYGVLIVPYSLIVLYWIHAILSRASPRKRYQTLMLPVCLSKLLGCILAVTMYQSLRTKGDPLDGNSIAYYIHHGLHQMIMFGYFLFLISGSMLKVRKSTRRDIAIGLGLVLLVTLGALAECVYHLSSPGSPHKLQWMYSFWAFRVAAIVLLGLQACFAFRLVHLNQHLRAHIQARLLLWLLMSLGLYFIVSDLIATLISSSLQPSGAWVVNFLRELSEFLLWVALGCILIILFTKTKKHFDLHVYTVRSAIVILEPELTVSRLFI